MLGLQWLGTTIVERRRNVEAPTSRGEPIPARSETPIPARSQTMEPLSGWKLTFWVLLAALVIAILMSFFSFLLRNDPFPWNLQQKLSTAEIGQVVQASVTSAAALGLGVTLLLSFRRQRTAEETQRTADANHAATLALLQLQQDQHGDARIAALRERHTLASEQLGSGAPAVQLAGVHSMASIIDAWRIEGYAQDVQAGINVLTGYRRMAEFNEEPEAAIAKEAAWVAVTNRIRTTTPESQRWDADIDFRGITIPAGGIKKLVIDARTVTFANSSVSAPDESAGTLVPTTFEETWIKAGGILDFDNTHLVSTSLNFVNGRFFIGELRVGVLSSAAGYLRFTGCKFYMTKVTLRTRKAGVTRIVFKDCSFEKGFLSFTGAESLESVQFLNCQFKDVKIYPPYSKGQPGSPEIKVLIDSQCSEEGGPSTGNGFLVDDQRQGLKKN